MATVKQNPGLNHLSYFANLILSTAISELLKGEKYLPLSAFRDMNIPEADISKAMNELLETGSFTKDGIVDGLDLDGEPATVDTHRTAGINLEDIALVVGFAGNSQPSIPEIEKPVDPFGIHDEKIGHALYRANIRDNYDPFNDDPENKMLPTLSIDRYTIDPETDAFLKVRHCIIDQAFKTGNEALDWFKDYIAEKSEGDSRDRLACPDGNCYHLDIVCEEEDSLSTFNASIHYNAEEGENRIVRTDEIALDSQAFTMFEEFLDEVFPAEPFTLEPQEPSDELKATEEFSIVLDNVDYRCVFDCLEKHDLVTFTSCQVPALKIKKDRPTSLSQLHLMVQTHLESALAN